MFIKDQCCDILQDEYIKMALAVMIHDAAMKNGNFGIIIRMKLDSNYLPLSNSECIQIAESCCFF